jgi:hypothetical protein
MDGMRAGIIMKQGTVKVAISRTKGLPDIVIFWILERYT